MSRTIAIRHRRLHRFVPPPRDPLVRYVGVLFSASRWRKLVVPEAQDVHLETLAAKLKTQSTSKTTDVSDTLAALVDPTHETEENETYRGSVVAATTYIDWATLLHCVFDVDALQCPRCGGRLRMISTITEPSAIAKILDCLGVESSPPLPLARAPDVQLNFVLDSFVA